MQLSEKIDKYLSVLCILLCVAFFFMPQLKYYSLHSGVADLGFFLAGLYKVNSQWPHIFYGHVQPYMYLYGFLFQIFPENYVPFLLLGLQSLVLLVATALIWKYYGKLAGFSMMMYTPLWMNNLFDFHFDHIAVLLMAIFFISCKRNKYQISMITMLLLCFVKEIFALQAIMCGVYLITEISKNSDNLEKKRNIIYTLLLVGFASLWFLVSIKYLLPFFSDSGKTALESSAFSWLGNNIYEIFISLLHQPQKILIEIITTPGKIYYLVMLFGPLLFISILNPLPLITAVPILMVSLLSRTPNYYDYAAHYSAGLIIPVIVSFSESIPKIQALFQHLYQKLNYSCSTISGCNNKFSYFFIITWIVVFQIAFGVSPISRLVWSDKIWVFNYQAYISSQRDADIRDAISKLIPIDDSIIISSQNNINYSPLFLRQNYLIFPGGVTEPHAKTNWDSKSVINFLLYLKGELRADSQQNFVYADYVLIDTARPYFIFDKGCDSIFLTCSNKNIEKDFLDTVRILESQYILLYENNGFKIFKKR
jgi:uncharacterized membrane protein